jgi:hypothetical protein
VGGSSSSSSSTPKHPPALSRGFKQKSRQSTLQARSKWQCVPHLSTPMHTQQHSSRAMWQAFQQQIICAPGVQQVFMYSSTLTRSSSQCWTITSQSAEVYEWMIQASCAMAHRVAHTTRYVNSVAFHCQCQADSLQHAGIATDLPAAAHCFVLQQQGDACRPAQCNTDAAGALRPGQLLSKHTAQLMTCCLVQVPWW